MSTQPQVRSLKSFLFKGYVKSRSSVVVQNVWVYESEIKNNDGEDLRVYINLPWKIFCKLIFYVSGLIFGIIDVDDEAREDMKYYYEKENANHQNYIGHDPEDMDQDDQDEDTKPILIHPEVDMVEGYDRYIPTKADIL